MGRVRVISVTAELIEVVDEDGAVVLSNLNDYHNKEDRDA